MMEKVHMINCKSLNLWVVHFLLFFFYFFRQVSGFDWVPKIYNELHDKKLLGILLDDPVSQKCEPVSQKCDQVS